MKLSFLSALLGGCCVFAGSPAEAAKRSEDVIPLGNLPLLFIDDTGVEQTRLIVRTPHAGKRRDEPVMVADKPWEFLRVYVATVHYDVATQEFRMWYLARMPRQVGEGSGVEAQETKLLYATSTDGIKWHKPALGLQIVGKSSANNVLAFEGGGGGEASILLDHMETDPSRRYKLWVHNRHGYVAAYSADGLSWTPYGNIPILPNGENRDTIKGTRDPRTGEYLAFHKQPSFSRGFSRRTVWLSRSRDFLKWSAAEEVFGADETDDEWSRGPQDRAEIYLMAVFPHAAGLVGLPSIFRHTPYQFSREQLLSGATPTTGSMDIQLLGSRDGRSWTRSWPRINIIPRGAPGTYDGGSIYNTSSEPVNVGDETWLYYTAINTGHGGPIPPKRVTIGLSTWRLHGFSSLDAGPEGGVVETKPLRLGSARLLVNANASRGRLRVALQEVDGREISGYGLADSVPLTSDQTRWVAAWRERNGAITDRPVRVIIEMEGCSLYSLGCAEKQ